MTTKYSIKHKQNGIPTTFSSSPVEGARSVRHFLRSYKCATVEVCYVCFCEVLGILRVSTLSVSYEL